MANELTPLPPDGQILIYSDGATQLRVRIDGQTVWLTQKLIAELYGVTVPTVNEHLKGIYADGELDPGPTIRSFRIVQTEGTRQVSRDVEHYSLDAILAVGYRVRSARGTTFRQWATARLSELLIKGFTLDDDRIKAGRTLGDDYFDELLARIRDIRASSIDYDKDAPLARSGMADHRLQRGAMGGFLEKTGKVVDVRPRRADTIRSKPAGPLPQGTLSLGGSSFARGAA